jgi:hypothetical protein
MLIPGEAIVPYYRISLSSHQEFFLMNGCADDIQKGAFSSNDFGN